ncbi:MAG: DUF4388 domain-containing protein [Pseudomonadota bacterium]
MPERKFLDINSKGEVGGLDAGGTRALASRAGRYWLHDSHPEIVFLTYAGLDTLPAQDNVERAIFIADLTALPALDVLGMISQSRLTLRVVAVHGGIERVVLFRDGEIASIASNDARDRIGNVLVRLGLVEREALEEVLRNAPPAGRRAGQLLVQSGLLSSHDLWRAIQQQVTELFCEVATWVDGHMVAYSLPKDYVFPQTPTIGAQGLLLEAVRRADEMALIRGRIPDNMVVLVATGSHVNIGAESVRVVEALREPRSVADLMPVIRMGEFDLLRVLYTLLQAGAIERVSPAPGTPVARPDGARVAEVLQVFEMALAEILEAVDEAGSTKLFVDGVNAFLADPGTPMSALFSGLHLEGARLVSLEKLVENVTNAQEQDPTQVVSDALNELLFFALFQCGELLESAVDENLARRVRMIYATLGDG